MNIFKPLKFKYGNKIHGTKLTKNSPIENMPAPATVYISVSQHIGAPAIPTVNIGDHVKKGQLIATAQGFVSANVYSSVSGTVMAINDILNGLGQKQKHIIIENDLKDEEVLFEDVKDLSPSCIIERTAEAGIVGLGGAGFPTAVKLSPKNQLDILLINGAECEPYLTCDYRLMMEKSQEIYEGIKLTAKALNVNEIVVGIEANKLAAIEIFSKFPDLKVVKLKKQYPMGSEKHLIYVTTGRKVPPGKMPFDAGVCVQNVKTVLAIYEAVHNNKPLTETVVTVSGKGIKTGKNLRVAIGTPFSEIIDYCGGTTEDTVKVIAGGPMMGRALGSLNQYVRKTDSGILCLKENETNLSLPTPCINCGVCAAKCPMRLMPMYIESYCLAENFKEAERYGAMNCIECGLCAYNCPAKRALVQSISYAKTKIKEMKKNG